MLRQKNLGRSRRAVSESELSLQAASVLGESLIHVNSGAWKRNLPRHVTFPDARIFLSFSDSSVAP